MRKIWVFTLILVILSQAAELHELVKLPVLFEHFAEHKQRDERVKFFDFLSMHYWGDDLDDNDDDRDAQLPFKDLDIHHAQVFFVPVVRAVKIKPAVFRITSHFPAYTLLYTPSPELSAPFRPPCA